MFDVKVLGSSSSGNCIYVDTGDCKFLLDVGLSYTKTQKMLHSYGISLSNINYIFITHEHGDHIKALPKILASHDIGIIATRGTLHAQNLLNPNIILIKDRETLDLKELTIFATKVNHDAREPVCFSITNSLGEKLLYLTDCGLAKYLKFPNYDFYIIEANYDRGILDSNFENGILHKIRYERALSGMGHLSINETIEFLERNIGDRTKQILLTHLSSENSNQELFKEKATSELFFFDINLAKEGTKIKCGLDSNPF